MEKADSLVSVLDRAGLSERARAELLRKIAFYHPDMGVALSSARQSLQIATAIGEPVLQAQAWEEIGHIERRLGNKSASLQATLKALGIFDALGLEEKKAAVYGQLAGNYLIDGDFESTIAYLKRGERIYQDLGDTLRYASTVLNLGEAYRLAGLLDSAVVCFRRSLRSNTFLKHEAVQGYTLGNLGMVYMIQNKLGLAKEKLDTAIVIVEGLGDSYSTSVYLAALGQIDEKEGNWKAAEAKLHEALALAQGAGLKEQIRDFSAVLSEGYEKAKDYKQALVYQKLFKTYQDSLVNKENIQEVERIKAGYEIDKRESEIELLNVINADQRRLAIVLGLGIFLLVFLSYLLYRGIRRIRKANVSLSEQKTVISKREAEKALLLRELNHRVKNNLQMISSLLSLQSRELTGHPAKAALIAGKDRVEALSLVHRKLYQEGLHTRVQAREYIEELVLGLFHSYGVGFDPGFNIEDISIDIDVAVPLALIVNELITNALKHAYAVVERPTLEVSLKAEKDRLYLQVEDNGVGFSPENNKSNSFGLKLIASLMEQLEGSIEKSNIAGTHWKLAFKMTST